jgi:cellulose synthase/poly-beta-1,6-N-acetylglucosamine synthase-like glycosyltransferase
MIFDMVEFAIIGMIITISCWGLYNVPILATGIIDYCKNRQKTEKKHFSHELLPTFSILVPVKNEENVIDRLLATLSKLNYPADKREIVIVEEGSTDKIPGICCELRRKTQKRDNSPPSLLNWEAISSKLWTCQAKGKIFYSPKLLKDD